MKDILNAPFLTEMIRTATNMYEHGWDERNGGNLSMLLEEAEVREHLVIPGIVRTIRTGFEAPELDGKIFLVTKTGSYFKNVQHDPAKNLGIVRLANGGREAEILWGFSDGGTVTSEFPAHIMSHLARLAVDPENRVIMHCHPTNLLAMTHVHDLDEKEFTRTLFRMCTECIMVFPDGVSVLPWMVCGTNEIGLATAKKMETARLCVWAMHGVYSAGKTLDETFGLIETAEKAAEIYLKIAHLERKQTITDEQLHLLEARFGVKAREGYLRDGEPDRREDAGMVTVYSSPLCPDCRECKANFDVHGIAYREVDITASMKNLKAFLKLRDALNAFDPCRKNGSVGIPAIVSEDGSVTLDWEGFLKERGLSVVCRENGPVCSLDGKGC